MNSMEPMLGLEELETFAQGLDHSEGIAVAPDGTIYVGGEAGQLYRVDADGAIQEVANTGGFMLGLALDAEGLVYACDLVARCVWRIDPADGSKAVFSNGTAERPFVSPNWGCFDADGNYYLSDSGDWKAGNGLIWVVRPGGHAAVWTEESRHFPNGMAVAPDGSRLFVLESTPGALVEFEIDSDGRAGARTVLCELPGAVPDGVAVATDGSLVIACYRPDIIYRWRADLGLQVLAHDPEGTAIAAPTNVAFVGKGLETMVVPNLGRWHLTRFRHPDLVGTPLPRPTREQLAAA
jgi:sugar lactone lactonase YvrE